MYLHFFDSIVLYCKIVIVVLHLLDILGAFSISKHPFRKLFRRKSQSKEIARDSNTHDRKIEKIFWTRRQHIPFRAWRMNVNYSRIEYQENCRTEWTPHRDTEFVLSTSSKAFFLYFRFRSWLQALQRRLFFLC